MTTSPPKTEPQGGAKLLIDLGPLLVFFVVNFFAPVKQRGSLSAGVFKGKSRTRPVKSSV